MYHIWTGLTKRFVEREEWKEKLGDRKKRTSVLLTEMVALASRRSRMQIVMTATTIMCAITAMTEHLGSVDNLCVVGL